MTKTAISGMIPVVGGIIAEASETVLAGAGLLKGAIGVFGLLGVLALCAYPFLQLGIQYLLYKLTAFLASVIGDTELCGLIGGLGLVPSSNIGSDYAMFEAVHGSAPDIAGKHLANPTAFLWSACMMLEYLGENETASRIRKAVDEVLAEGKHLTRDLHGEASTEEYVDAVIARL